MKKRTLAAVAGLGLTALLPGCGSSSATTQFLQQFQENPPAPLVKALNFLTEFVLRTNHDPLFVKSVDFNQDGKLDLLVASGSSQRSFLEVHLGKGDGTFGEPRAFDLGDHILFASVHDFNGDGHLDVVCSLRDQQKFSVGLGDGSGAIREVRFFDTIATQMHNVVGGDFNGDGRLDVALFGRSSNNVAVHFGDGSGNFGTASTFSAGGNGSGLATALVNNDNFLDLVITDENNARIGVLLGVGDGTFGAVSTFNTGGSRPRDVVLRDLNGDNHLDALVACFESNTVATLLGDGTGAFGASQQFATNGRNPRYLALADFDGDGKIDVVTGNRSDEFPENASLLLGNGDGTLQAGVNIQRGSYRTPTVAAGDFNGDGFPDLALGNRWSHSVTLALNDGKANFAADLKEHILVEAGSNERDAKLFDMNGDGNLDLVVANRGPRGSNPGSLSICLGNGNGTFQAPQNFPAGNASNGLAVADFNGDGKLDAIVGNARGSSNHASIFLGNGDGSVGAPQNVDLGFNGDAGACEFAVADFDLDGDLDVIQSVAFDNNQNNIFLLENNGSGVFTPKSLGFGGNRLIDVATADLNQDGKPDLVVANQSGAAVRYLGNGNGTFTPGEPLSFGQSNRVQAVELGDLNGDGIVDAVTTSDYSDWGFLTTFLGKGDGTFQPPLTTNFPAEWSRALVLGDFNGDGMLDAVVGDQYGAGVIGFAGLGNGLFNPFQVFGGGPQRTLFAGDVDKDGDLDLVGANPESNHVRVILNALK